MKILFTGCTISSILSPVDRPGPADYLTADTAFIAGLRRLGHEVDVRWVRAGEDLAMYDLAFVGLRDPLSDSGVDGLLGAFYAASTARRVVINPQSAALHALRFNCAQMDTPERWRRRLGNGAGLERAPLPQGGDWSDRCVQTARAIFSGRWPTNWRGVLRAFPWVDLDRYARLFGVAAGQLAALDPSYAAVALAESVHSERRFSKERQWCFATLGDHSAWLAAQQLEWPVFEHPAGVRVSEWRVLRELHESWGALAQPYTHDGGGWWRSRIVFAAVTGTVLAGAPLDGARMDFSYQQTPQQVEQLAISRLEELAERQREFLLAHLWRVEHFDKALSILVDRAMRL